VGKGKAVAALVAGAAGITLVAIPLTRHTIIETGRWVAGFATDGWESLSKYRLAAMQMRSLRTMLRGHPDGDLFDRLIAGSTLDEGVKAIMRRMRAKDVAAMASNGIKTETVTTAPL
jgi:hypothetical protein